MNNGYAIYVWRDGYDPTIPGCSQSDFLNWDKHSKCFTHTWDTHSRRQWLWNTCKVQGREIRKIFLADVHHKLRDGFNAKSCGIPGIQLIKQTLSEGHSTVPGLQVYALFAVSDIDVSEKNLIKHVEQQEDNRESEDGESDSTESYDLNEEVGDESKDFIDDEDKDFIDDEEASSENENEDFSDDEDSDYSEEDTDD
ncbi:unnamed protein product [Mytilus edulis]|uniref:Uncharacterized protein n=1 Tax=Mytilus edulis TaxID=6550 RepID=A0A8S3T5M2_MYTED|nr:unnamed protein product [Mytilus edulis]